MQRRSGVCRSTTYRGRPGLARGKAGGRRTPKRDASAPLCVQARRSPCWPRRHRRHAGERLRRLAPEGGWQAQQRSGGGNAPLNAPSAPSGEAPSPNEALSRCSSSWADNLKLGSPSRLQSALSPSRVLRAGACTSRSTRERARGAPLSRITRELRAYVHLCGFSSRTARHDWPRGRAYS